MLQNGSSLMLMGYLIRTQEEKNAAPKGPRSTSRSPTPDGLDAGRGPC